MSVIVNEVEYHINYVTITYANLLTVHQNKLVGFKTFRDMSKSEYITCSASFWLLIRGSIINCFFNILMALMVGHWIYVI